MALTGEKGDRSPQRLVLVWKHESEDRRGRGRRERRAVSSVSSCVRVAMTPAMGLPRT